ncbi:UNVERIFIED_CONTAM: hypothetical protein Sangu_0011500 [Sesamum angustifolium]|uniref:Uncharacterized protein n=1 Tax=Sesamum angustifolium TaxID=2727405 RepID=A0AAW2RH19_9LAMI
MLLGFGNGQERRRHATIHLQTPDFHGWLLGNSVILRTHRALRGGPSPGPPHPAPSPPRVGRFLGNQWRSYPSSDAVSIALRRDRVDKDSSEVTYVTTDSIKISGPVEFEVCEEGKDLDLILCGSLQRADAAAAWSNGSVLENDSKTGWSMDCYVANAIATNGRSTFFQPKIGICSPSIEVYVAGCCSGVPVILTKTILVSPRKKVSRQGMLDAIPEDEEMGKEQRSLSNGLLRQRKLPVSGCQYWFLSIEIWLFSL